ncbi:MAG: hypothetical protein V3T05_04430, partial [Myxococcota bacterium]
MKKLLLFVIFPMVFAACGDSDSPAYDATLLAQYRSAIPNEGQLAQAETPTASGTRQVAGDPAPLADMAANNDGIAQGINSAVSG